ncbi:hypothetical protein HY412_01005 [Candidatus Kaiserbacteria bacterium]|nr:hypothetical protein [Candidatus Kaiserbacteria bacterium]
MNLTETMERTLQIGTLPVPTVQTGQVPQKTCEWQFDFCHPMMVALHLGTPKPSLHTVKPVSAGTGLMFID